MTPHQGQGGTQAVEDAEGFGLFLTENITSADVLGILKNYDSVRRPRASQIQVNTRKATEQKSPQEVYSFTKYNWTYPGIIEGLNRVRSGEVLIQF
jgi:salicylate hydroxylase